MPDLAAQPDATTAPPEMESRVWFWLTCALWLAFTVVLLATMRDYGMSWDEITRWNSGDSKLRYYERLITESSSVWGSSSGDLYPGLFDLPLAAFAKYTGVDRAFAGHLYTVFFSVIGVMGAGMIGRAVGGWRLSFFASLLLILLPRFYGHCVFNPKDIPFAATYTWGLWGIMHCAAGFRDHHKLRWLIVGILAGLAMSSRLPGMIILAYLFGMVGYRLFTQVIPTKERPHWQMPSKAELQDCFLGLIISVVTATFLLMVFFPSSHHNPFTDSIKVVDRLHSFSQAIPLLFRGNAYDAGSAPWYYTPWMLGVTTPVWQLLLLVGGVVITTRHVVKKLLLGDWWHTATVRRATVLLAFCFPFTYLLITQPAIHNGVRHFLFILPAGAVLMALALVSFVDALKRKWKVQAVVPYLAFALGACFNLLALYRMHPYQYVYFNELAGGPAAALGQYETEYWFTSMPEGMAKLQAWRREQGLPEAPVRVLMTGPREIAEYQMPDGWTLANPGTPADYFLGNTQFAGHLLVDGREIITIERMGLSILVIKDLTPETNSQ